MDAVFGVGCIDHNQPTNQQTRQYQSTQRTIEFTHNFIFKIITTLDLTSNFIGTSSTGIDAHDIGQTFGIEDAFAQLQGTFLKQTRDNFRGWIGGGGSSGNGQYTGAQNNGQTQ